MIFFKIYNSKFVKIVNHKIKKKMETAIINKPIHHRKTKEIAEVVVNSLEAELFDLKDFNPYIMKGYDVIGLGSQLYWFKLIKS